MSAYNQFREVLIQHVSQSCTKSIYKQCRHYLYTHALTEKSKIHRIKNCLQCNENKHVVVHLRVVAPVMEDHGQ